MNAVHPSTDARIKSPSRGLTNTNYCLEPFGILFYHYRSDLIATNMSFFSRKKLPASGLASHWQQPWLVCTWSARSPQSGLLSGSSLPRSSHTVTTTPTTAGKLFLFGGNDVNNRASSDVYVISTREYSTTLLQTRGDIPAPRFGHSAAITSTTLLIWGGTSNSDVKDALNHESLYLLNLGTSDLCCQV